MSEERKRATEQLRDAERLAKVLVNIPEEKRSLAVMMTNSFVAGMEAARDIYEPTTKKPA